MVSTTLMICTGAISVAIVVALMMGKPRRRLSGNAGAEATRWRDMTFAGTLLNFAAALGLARDRADRSGDGDPDGGYSWHGSHLDHSPHGGLDGGGFSDGGGGDGGSGGAGI